MKHLKDVQTSFFKVGVYTAAKPARVSYLEENGTLPAEHPCCKMSAHQKTLRKCTDADETSIRKVFSAPGRYSSAKAKRDPALRKELPASWAICQERGRIKFKSLHHDSEQAAPPQAHTTALALGLSIVPE